jgi:diketogulonate reductase-like aldo/keto reductase
VCAPASSPNSTPYWPIWASSPWPGSWPGSPGSSSSPARAKLQRLEENLEAADVELSTDELTEIQDAASEIQVQGGRYNEAADQMTHL